MNIAILISQENQLEQVSALVRTIAEYKLSHHFECYLLDNNCCGDQKSYFLSQEAWLPVRRAESSTRLSFAAAYNTLLRKASAGQFDRYLILHNVAHIQSQDIQKLIDSFTTQQAVLVGLRIKKVPALLSLALCGSKDKKYLMSPNVLLLNSACLKQLGYFDESYYRDQEVFAYALKAQLNNVKVQAVDVAAQTHAQATINPRLKSYFYSRNLYLLFRQFNTSKLWPLQFVLLNVYVFSQAFSRPYSQFPQAFFAGVRDGWRLIQK